MTEPLYPDASSSSRGSTIREADIEAEFIEKLGSLKYVIRPDIRDRAALEANFRQKFEALNHVRLSDGEFSRLMDGIVSSDVYTAAKILRERNSFTRDDDTQLNFTLVNIKDWCKNHFEVVNQLRININSIGYVSHTFCNGKMRTSFKASTLLKDNRVFYKCIFVVESKGLPGQLSYTRGSPSASCATRIAKPLKAQRIFRDLGQ